MHADSRCETAKACNMSLCTSKDIEADLTSSSGRWIVLGHTSIDNNEDKDIPKDVFSRYTIGVRRLGIQTDYTPINCVLDPMKSAFTLFDACDQDTGLHFIFIGDSVTGLHLELTKRLLNKPRYRITYLFF